MNKGITIVVIFIVMLGICVFIYKVATTNPGQTNTPATNTGGNTFPSTVPTSPNPTPSGSTGGRTLPVASATGGTILVNDFSKNSDLAADPVNKGYYYLGYHYGTDPKASANPPYVIEYISSTGYFNIALLQEPLKQTRLDMELYLEQTLGLSPSGLCTLSYMVSTPGSVSEVYTGQNLGFSSCQGSTKLP